MKCATFHWHVPQSGGLQETEPDDLYGLRDTIWKIKYSLKWGAHLILDIRLRNKAFFFFNTKWSFQLNTLGSQVSIKQAKNIMPLFLQIQTLAHLVQFYSKRQYVASVTPETWEDNCHFSCYHFSIQKQVANSCFSFWLTPLFYILKGTSGLREKPSGFRCDLEITSVGQSMVLVTPGLWV